MVPDNIENLCILRSVWCISLQKEPAQHMQSKADQEEQIGALGASAAVLEDALKRSTANVERLQDELRRSTESRAMLEEHLQVLQEQLKKEQSTNHVVSPASFKWFRWQLLFLVVLSFEVQKNTFLMKRQQ